MVTMFALLLALGTKPCLPAELGKIDPPSAIVAQAAAPPPAPPPPPPPPPPRQAAPVPAPLHAALALEERAQYRINFGMLGQLGELNLNLTPGQTGEMVRLLGQVKASLFGLGETEKRIASEVYVNGQGARRWTSLRVTSGKTVTDFARQTSPGTVALVRRRPGKPDQPETLVRKAVVMDPLAFILRMRLAPPRTPQVYEVLDGHGLWLLTISPATQVSGGDLGRALRLDGKAKPVFWDGSADDDRPSRSFTVWLSDDQFHTPLRLVMPLSVGEVRADLVTVSRNPPLAKVLAANPQAMLPLKRYLGKGLREGRRPQ
jgi:hypothetical protein